MIRIRSVDFHTSSLVRLPADGGSFGAETAHHVSWTMPSGLSDEAQKRWVPPVRCWRLKNGDILLKSRDGSEVIVGRDAVRQWVPETTRTPEQWAEADKAGDPYEALRTAAVK